MTGRRINELTNQRIPGRMLSKRYSFPRASLFKLKPVEITARDGILRKLADGTYGRAERDCAICDSREFEKLAETDRWGLPVSTVICRSCGLVQTNPCMTEESYRAFYRDDYRWLYGAGSELNSPGFFSYQERRGGHILNLLRYTNILPQIPSRSVVLDVGTGSGGVVRAFEKAGYRSLGVDLDHSCLEYGLKQGLDLRKGSIHQLALNERPALILYSQVLEHIVDVKKELARAKELLSDDGFLFVALPGIMNIRRAFKHRGDFLRYLEIAHVNHFTLRTLDNLLGQCGLERIAGNEEIWAVYGKTTRTWVVANDYLTVKRFLSRTEQFRIVFAVCAGLRAIVDAGLDWIGRLLKGSVLDASARNIYRRMKFGHQKNAD